MSRSLPHTLSASRPSLLVPGWPLRLLARLLHWQQNIRTRRQLALLDPRLLGDAGIDLAAREEELRKPFWCD